VAGVTAPSPNVIASVFFVLRHASTESPIPIQDTLHELISLATDEEAQDLGAAVGRCLALLLADDRRFNLTLDLVRQLDLYEALPSVLALLAERSVSSVALTAAVLAGNPGVSETERLRAWDSGLNSAESVSVRHAIDVIRNSENRPNDELGLLLRAQRWPGLATPNQRRLVAPLVAIDELNAPAIVKWQVIDALVAAGAAIRRIPSEWSARALPGWLSDDMPIVTWAPEAFARIHRSFPDVTADQLVVARSDSGGPHQVIRSVAHFLGDDRRFRPPARIPGMEFSSAISPDVFRLGSLDSREIALLTGTRRVSLYTELREFAPPSKVIAGENFWTFNQVVALRTYQHFRSQVGSRRVSKDIIRNLTEFAGAANPTKVGVTADGEVLQQHGDNWIDVTTHQVYMEPVRTLDRVFDPFLLGGENDSVPALLTPADHAKVHPVLAGGSPVIEGTRIPVRAVAKYYSEVGGNFQSVVDAYGLSGPVAEAVLSLGQRLLAA
jgi:uncharacterized protein (DUF433 family)